MIMALTRYLLVITCKQQKAESQSVIFDALVFTISVFIVVYIAEHIGQAAVYSQEISGSQSS